MTDAMKVLILGGDGYLGWPTAMHLSAHGHQVMAVDNYMRRTLCRERNVPTLFDPPNLNQRAVLWKEKSGHDIQVKIGDLRDWDFMAEVVGDFAPDAVIHYAEQPSAPYSMADRRSASLTLMNNIGVTFNVIQAIREFVPGAHLIKLGTMGEYGTPNIEIEEGWLDVEHKGRSQRFLYPRQAGSLYHTTKVMDTDLLWFYVRNWKIRATDLMQGPVYGLITDESGKDEGLMPFFNYDETFGTVLNRFVVQAVAGIPLTVYGKGGQTRGYLNIKDTLQCLRLAVENPADAGELRIFNQFTETFSVNELAARVQAAGAKMDIDVKIKSLPNPRIELEEHYYNPASLGLVELGLKPHLLTDEVLVQMMELVRRRKTDIRNDIILPRTQWN